MLSWYRWVKLGICPQHVKENTESGLKNVTLVLKSPRGSVPANKNKIKYHVPANKNKTKYHVTQFFHKGKLTCGLTLLDVKVHALYRITRSAFPSLMGQERCLWKQVATEVGLAGSDLLQHLSLKIKSVKFLERPWAGILELEMHVIFVILQNTVSFA